ncbi:MAG: MBL fold metallo-hydrolase [Phycisphaera sp.]|nr:MBL fold metallo-hydrolase [Phycisphaera sp.]
MRFCIHRGTHEIGGTCVEIESQGKRIVLDIGLPLDVTDPDAMALHPVPGFDKPDPSLLGVVISHPHQDHYGLAYRLPQETTFLIGEAAQSILEAADFFTPAGLKLQHVIHMAHRIPIELGPFTITPYLVDHSAYDAYAVLVEADGKRLFYSGDFRAHGRKAKLVEQLIADPPKDVDVLLMEGTTLGRPESEQGFPSEDELVPKFVEMFEQTDGLVLVWASGQNIDRLVTLYKACRRAKRQLILDVYTIHILRATGNEHIPQAGWQDIRVFLPKSQKRRILQDQSFELVNPLKTYRIYPEAFATEADRSVMLFRPSMIRDLDAIEHLKIGRLIVSVWGGYLKNEKNKPLMGWLEQRSIPMDRCHTSGHADANLLGDIRRAFPQALLVPIHGEAPETFARWPDRLLVGNDGEWYEINY